MKMKKSFLFAAALSLMAGFGFTACDDDDDDSKKDIGIEGDGDSMTLDYTVELKIGESYEGKQLSIDLASLAKFFGYETSEELVAAIESSDVTGFALTSAGEEDATNGATTTNGAWGHWFAATGDATTWGTEAGDPLQAVVYAEFTTDETSGESYFGVGQYPDRITEETTLKVTEGLKVEDAYAYVNITFHVAKEEINASEVASFDLTCDLACSDAYDAQGYEFDLASILDKLGATEYTLVTPKEDGEMTSNLSQGAGFWYGTTGYWGQWGDTLPQAALYAYNEDNVLYVGQYPGHVAVGDVIKFKYCFMSGNNYVTLNVTVNIIEDTYEDPETAPAGDPESATYDLTLSKPYSNDYASISVDIADQLKNAFKMTTYQIYSAIKSGDLKMYLNEVTEADPSYTANAPGYWISETGAAIEYASGHVYVEMGYDKDMLVLNYGVHPDNATAGESFTGSIIIVCNGVSVTYNVSYAITEAEAAAE